MEDVMVPVLRRVARTALTPGLSPSEVGEGEKTLARGELPECFYGHSHSMVAGGLEEMS